MGCKPWIFLCAIATVLTACQAPIRPIDQAFISELSEQENGATITVNSLGGASAFGVRAAHIIQEKALHVVIDDYCFSSCVEYILPAARSVRLHPTALIGFHQNPMMIDDFKRRKTLDNTPICFYGDDVAAIRTLHESRLKQSDFWKTVEQKLDVQDIQIQKQGDCYVTGFKFAYDMWFPDSQTLRRDFGLSFSGSVCADHPSCKDAVSARGLGTLRFRF